MQLRQIAVIFACLTHIWSINRKFVIPSLRRPTWHSRCICPLQLDRTSLSLVRSIGASIRPGRVCAFMQLIKMSDVRMQLECMSGHCPGRAHTIDRSVYPAFPCMNLPAGS
jgi:hypothetical protein